MRFNTRGYGPVAIVMGPDEGRKTSSTGWVTTHNLGSFGTKAVGVENIGLGRSIGADRV